MIEFLLTTDPKLVMDWALTLLFMVCTVFVVVLGGSLVVKGVAEMWGLGKWL